MSVRRNIQRNMVSALVIVAILVTGACNSDVWDDVPVPITNFISRYFPFGELESYTTHGNTETVTIKNGATLTFDSDYEWTDVNGNGMTLPSQFLFDCLPATLYKYIEGLEMQADVYRVTRTSVSITVDLHSTEVVYNRSDGDITEE